MSATATKETLGFQAEVKQLLHLMIHSLYSNKEIFLRELISNASDAADKLRFEALSDASLYGTDADLRIRVSIDRAARTLCVSDNGVGMSRDEVIANIGTIAKSGTREFFQALTGDQAKDAHLIGQFGSTERMKTVYLETSIFSFYYDERTQPDIVARRDWTREFWENCRTQYDFVTSTAVLAELLRGNKPHKSDALKLAQTLPAVEPDNAVDEVVLAYLKHKLMPADPAGDVLHLALASYNRHDFLATGNCQHLANANKTDHIEHVNDLLGLPTPKLVTPMELLGVDGPD